MLLLAAVPDDAFETHYVDEPVADADEVPTERAAPAADDAADE